MSDRVIKISIEAEADTAAAEAALQRLQSLGRSLTGDISSGLQGMILQGRSLEATLKSVAMNVSRRALANAFTPLEERASTIVNGLLGSLTPFARGGVFDGPQPFTFGAGSAPSLGVLGEAGPEAVLPLVRDGSGRLGVRSAAGGGTQVTVNISTPDLAGFQRAEQQVAAAIARAVRRGRRSL